MKISDEKLQERLGWKPHKGQYGAISAFNRGEREIVLACGRRMGKALDINTPILTRDGWKKMSDIQVGDFVYGNDGKPTKVIFVTEIMNGHKCYKITFSDGSEIIADAEHQWEVESKKYRKNIVRTKNTSSKKEVKKTEELFKDFKTERKDGKFESNYSIPNCSPIEYDEKILPIDPYVFGCWLGDGSSNSGMLTTDDIDLIDIFDKKGYFLKKLKPQYCYSIVDKTIHIGVRYPNKEYTRSIIIQLNKLGVRNNKHIPTEYLYSSTEQRMELLRGLMDTDGYCDKNGQCEYCGVNKKLIDNVLELVLSFGIKATLYDVDCKLNGRYIGRKYRIHFSTDLPVFRLERKLNRLLGDKKSDIRRRFIEKIEEVESRSVKCISVDNNSHLYLAGRNLIPTHNTDVCAYIAQKASLKPNQRIWIVSGSYELSQRVFSKVIFFVNTLFKDNKAYKIKMKPSPRLEFSNGSFIQCKSATEPDSLLGEALDLIIVDEAVTIPPLIYERFLYPTTSTTKGQIIFISSPRGKDWFYRKYIECCEHCAGFNFPSNVNPMVTKEEWERARKMLPEQIFKQEYMGLFLDDAASVFRGVRKIVNKDCYEEPKDTHSYVIGVDLGKFNDFTVITVLDRQTHKVVHWDRFNQINWPFQKERIKLVANKYRTQNIPSKIILDSTGLGSPIADDLKRDGLYVEEFKFTGGRSGTKEQMIEKLSLFIEQLGVFIPDEMVLLDELESYGCEVSDAGYKKYSAPMGQHDDAVCSLALAVWGLYSPKTETELPKKIIVDKGPLKLITNYRKMVK
jgi:hypothetical protein